MFLYSLSLMYADLADLGRCSKLDEAEVAVHKSGNME